MQVENNSYDVEVNSIGSNTFQFFSRNYSSVSDVSMPMLQEYIRYPMIYNAILREISRQAYNSNGMYARSVDTRVALPLLSYILVSRNTKPKSKANIKKRKKKLQLMLNLINHQKTTRDILMKLDIDGMYVGVLRDTSPSNKNIDGSVGLSGGVDHIEGLSLDNNFMIQPLDLDYIDIAGIQNNALIARFDMSFFDQYTYGGLVNAIKNYPREFISAYMVYKKDATKRWHILDYKKTMVLTARANLDERYGRPYGLESLADIKMHSDYVSSQYKLITELASSIYYLVLPQGEKIGSCSLTKAQQDAVIDAFRNAVRLNTDASSAKVSTLSLPPNTKIERVSKDSSLLKDTLSDENIKKISTSLGFASAALNASSDGSSSFAGLQINLDITSAQVFQMLEIISSEYTRVLNEYEGVLPSDYIEVNYLPISYLNKNEFSSSMKDLYMTSGGSRYYYIASTGVDPYKYLSVCDEEREDDLDNLYPAHITSYTASDSGDKPNPDDNLGGRPTKDKKDMSVSGLKTRESGSNKVIKPSTK